MKSNLEGLVDVQPHRIGANLTFDQDGLQPYWGLVSAFEPDIDGTEVVMNGETFVIDSVSSWSGQIAPPPGNDHIDGGMYEYSISVWSDDESADKGANFKFRPGYPDATDVRDGSDIRGIPDDIPESIRIQVESTNLSQTDVVALLQATAAAIDLNPQYFNSQPHEWSSIYALEAYLRIAREVAIDRLVATGGVLNEIAQFCRDRGRGEYHWDHEDIEGKYEAVALDPDNWQRLIPDQTLAKRVKAYQPANVRDEDDGDPLYHPKLEAQFWSGYYSSDDESLDWDGYHYAMSELRETLLNVLNWGDVTLEPDSDIYIADDYWTPDRSSEPVDIHSNPISDLKERQQITARDSLLDPDVSRGEFDVLEAMTDGGPDHHETLADDADRSSSTVYRAAEQFDDILEVDNGEVRFVDDVVRQEIEEIVERFRQIKDNTVDALRKVASKANPLSRDEDDEPSALERWMNRHGIQPRESYDGLELELSRPVSRRKLQEILRAGLQAAELSGFLTTQFEDATIDWVDADGNQHRNWQVVVDGEILTAGGGSAPV